MSRISWSAAQLFRGCPKRWAFKHLDKEPEPPQPQFEHGNKVHSDIEHALDNVFNKDKPAFPPVSYVNFAIDLVGSAAPDKVLIEEWVNKESEGVKVSGKADCIMELEDQTAVIDWKTSKKKPTGLKPDVRDQLHLYGHMLDLSDNDRVIAAYPEHEVFFPVSFDVERGKKVFTSLVDTAHLIEDFKDSVSCAAEIGGTPTRLCGWCPFEEICPDAFGKQRK